MDGVSKVDVVALDGVGDEFGQAVSLGVRDFQHAGDVAHGVLGHHFAEGGDVGDAVGAVLAGTVFNHLVAAGILDIGINIGHRNAVGVQEALKEQIVFQGVKLGDTESVGEDGAGGRATARTEDDALGFAPVDEILDDEEVAVVAHLVHHGKFVVNAGEDFEVLGGALGGLVDFL